MTSARPTLHQRTRRQRTHAASIPNCPARHDGRETLSRSQVPFTSGERRSLWHCGEGSREVPKDAPRPVRLPDEIWNRPDVLALCQAQDADGLFRLAKKYGSTNESIGYWTGIDPGEISKRINGAKGPVRALDRWQRIADGLNLPAHARQALGLAAPTSDGGIEVARPSLPGVGPLLTDRGLVMAAEESAQFGEWAESATAGRLSVDQLAADLRSLSLLYLTGAPVPVFLGARTVRNRAERLLRAHSTPGRSRELGLSRS